MWRLMKLATNNKNSPTFEKIITLEFPNDSSNTCFTLTSRRGRVSTARYFLGCRTRRCFYSLPSAQPKLMFSMTIDLFLYVWHLSPWLGSTLVPNESWMTHPIHPTVLQCVYRTPTEVFADCPENDQRAYQNEPKSIVDPCDLRPSHKRHAVLVSPHSDCLP